MKFNKYSLCMWNLFLCYSIIFIWAILSCSFFLIAFFFFCLPVYVGLASHVCNLLIETVSLYLEVDDKSSTKTANALLLSLLDILHCMLMYTANIVRQTLQVWSLFPGSGNHLKHFFRYLFVILMMIFPLF